MALKLLAEVSPQDLLVALTEVHSHLLGYVKSLALKSIVDLGIPEAIHRRRGSATLADIAADAKVHPAKVPDLKRIMDLLTASGLFTNAGGEYKLTTACRFLVGWRNLSPMVPFLVNPLIVSSFFTMGDWLKSEPSAAGSLFQMQHGCSQWERAGKDAALNAVLNNSMAADSQLFLEVVILDKGRIFRGLTSLVDVGGGNGAGTQVIAKAFPRIQCTVLDLPQVVDSLAAPSDGNLRFVAGDMFESIPPANAVLLKNILHDWGHDDCVELLRRCKEAIPTRSAGGKVIIIEMVRESLLGDSKITEMEAIQNVFMMSISGVERAETEWKRIFSDAGFSDDYKIMPILGPYSVIEIYP